MSVNSDDNILLVDDSIDAVNLMKRYLTHNGYTVKSITNSLECVDIFVNSEFQLVILDFAMPGLNGIEVLKKLRTFRTPEELPIILITARQSKKLLNAAIECGASDFILKPIRGSDFVSRVEKHLIKISDEQIVSILLSLNVSDPSTLDESARQNLFAKNLSSYPFYFGGIKCCAIMETSKKPHVLAHHPIGKIAEELVLIAKGGFLWNAFWPRQLKPRFSITKYIINNHIDLADLTDE